MMRNVTVCLGVLLLGSGLAFADIGVVVATDGSDKLVIARTSEFISQRSDMGFMRDGSKLVPFHGMADCATFGSTKIAEARKDVVTGKVMLARYNAVSLWLGRVCFGKSDMLPESGEARAWLDDIATEVVEGKPLLDAHDMWRSF